MTPTVQESPVPSDSKRSALRGSETGSISKPYTRQNRSMGAFTERHYPWLGGLISGALCYLLLRHWTILPGTKDLLVGFLNVAAILTGFLLTANSILLSIDEKWIIRRSKEAGAYEMLVGYLVSATYWWLATALLSAVGVA